MTKPLNHYLSAFTQPKYQSTLAQIGRGVEREALRVLKEGKLSEHPHYQTLGSALTHPYITTDYSETLLEFITPVSQSIEQTVSQLEDIQRFTFKNIDGELLWPFSMPCFVSDEDKIPLAQYGSSNVGKMKTTYRQGLKNRYGSMMQVIAGIHFNFSFSLDFWRALHEIDESEQAMNRYISERYFALIRNYKRYCWLIPYLFGSSSVICRSFLQDKEAKLPFKTSDNGYLYLEYATSLRMSDLGYTNSAQSALSICYNDIHSYIDGVKNAISLSSDEFNEIGVKVNGEYRQLNANVLQIENELYAPIRPKRVAMSGEKPSEALERGGVEYIEVRALDVNPFAATGISEQQIYFLDVFLTFCALSESPNLTAELQHHYEENMNDVVVKGRQPGLTLIDKGEQRSLVDWGKDIFQQLMDVAHCLDAAYDTNKYSKVVANEAAKISDPSLTPSAKILHHVVEQGESLTKLALDMADSYRDELLSNNREFKEFSEQSLQQSVKQSILDQIAIEEADELSFDDFLSEYFSKES